MPYMHAAFGNLKDDLSANGIVVGGAYSRSLRPTERTQGLAGLSGGLLGRRESEMVRRGVHSFTADKKCRNNSEIML